MAIESIISIKEEILIRPATLEDIPTISELATQTFTLTFGYSLPPSDLATFLVDAYSIPSLTGDLKNPNMTTFVASPSSSPEKVLGFTQLTRGTTEPCLSTFEKIVELQRLYVGPEAQGKGVGRLLTNAVEEVARKEGWKTLWLGVWEENSKAQGAYEKMGFRKCGEHDFVMGSCVQTDWIMKKSL